MKETRIIINSTENAEIKITAEQNFNPLFSETFLSLDKPLDVHLIDKETISGEDACKSASTTILSNLLGIIQKADGNVVVLDLGKLEGIMPLKEQIPTHGKQLFSMLPEHISTEPVQRVLLTENAISA